VNDKTNNDTQLLEAEPVIVDKTKLSDVPAAIDQQVQSPAPAPAQAPAEDQVQPKTLADYAAYAETATPSDLEAALAGLNASARKRMEALIAGTVNGSANQGGESQQQDDSSKVNEPANGDTQQPPAEDDVVLVEDGQGAKSHVCCSI